MVPIPKFDLPDTAGRGIPLPLPTAIIMNLPFFIDLNLPFNSACSSNYRNQNLRI